MKLDGTVGLLLVFFVKLKNKNKQTHMYTHAYTHT